MNGIPILMYHALVKTHSEGIHPVHITVSSFEEQMKWLSDAGYTVISFEQAVQSIKTKKVEDKTVVITFDDGYWSLCTYAWPILEKHQFKATLFLTTAGVGLKSYKDLTGFNMDGQPTDDRPLQWGELKEMLAGAWSIQAHGHGHPSLPKLPPASLEFELQQSKQCIEQNLGNKAKYFAYPFGHYDRKTVALVKRYYEAACAVHSGYAIEGQDLHRLFRIEINSSDTLASFAEKVSTGYATRQERTKARVRDFIFRNIAIKDFWEAISTRSFVG